jgi:hypothetical protein
MLISEDPRLIFPALMHWPFDVLPVTLKEDNPPDSRFPSANFPFVRRGADGLALSAGRDSGATAPAFVVEFTSIAGTSMR